jgi:ribosome recycling factor
MISELKEATKNRMQKSIEVFKANLAKVRTGRAHTGLLDHVTVDYYGQQTMINQVASLKLLDARTIGVQPHDKKMLSSIEKAIRDADLGLNPSAMGDMIRVPMPMLTEERRKELTKLVRREAEEARVGVRNIRRDAINELKSQLKDKKITEDEERRSQDEIQKMTDKYVMEMDQLLADKEKELMVV